MSGPLGVVLRAASLMFTGLFAGFLLGALVLEASLRGFGSDVYVAVRQVELVGLDRLAAATLVPALLTTAVIGFGSGGTSERRAARAAATLLLGIAILSALVNVPINLDQADWSIEAAPADWAETRDRWQLAHVARTIAAIVAFLALVVAAVSRRTLVSPDRYRTDARRDVTPPTPGVMSHHR
jgi:uncharacterized membrane protein